jgi:Macrophage migration inhibitory factor (MIF)
MNVRFVSQGVSIPLSRRIFTRSGKSIGKIDREMNVNTSKGLSEFFQEELGLPSDRGYISFHDMKGSNIGYKGATF